MEHIERRKEFCLGGGETPVVDSFDMNHELRLSKLQNLPVYLVFMNSIPRTDLDGKNGTQPGIKDCQHSSIPCYSAITQQLIKQSSRNHSISEESFAFKISVAGLSHFNRAPAQIPPISWSTVALPNTVQ